MDRGRSKIIFSEDRITKVVKDDEEYDMPVEVAASREVYLMTLARYVYRFVPKVIELKDNIIVMEKIDAVQMDVFLKKNPYKDNVDYIYDQIKSIVTLFAKVGIRHRDLSYQNILIDSNRNIWIIDFGRSEYIFDVEKTIKDELETFDDLFKEYIDVDFQ